ncbi:uncharacterized protein LOC106136363 [Amyelois transitella]|uniref:uncharacterized protein LOC106136363 n=1 Tax=Amyelois transitella TaxID=680683 RepID=UPI00067BAE84|nr:uncharacterized protein LOC106136363 [Amyelois transitella]
MFKVTFIVVALAVSTLSAELSPSYASLEKNAPFKPDLKTAPANQVEAKPELEHPIYRPEEHKKEGRVKIQPVRPQGSSLNHDRMLSDQPIEATTEVNRIDNLAIPNYGFVANPVEVAYPDIPYAPGYGYDNGYSGPHGYEMYANNPSNYYLEPDTSTFGLLWSQVPDSRTLVSYVGRTISWIFGSMFTLFLGSLLTVGVCTYTNLCSIAFHGVGPIHEEMRALMSPERLERISNAADFVKTAIDKYQKIQKVTDSVPGRQKRAIFNF